MKISPVPLPGPRVSTVTGGGRAAAARCGTRGGRRFLANGGGCPGLPRHLSPPVIDQLRNELFHDWPERKRPSSAAVGAVAGPRLVTDSAAAAFARRAAEAASS